MTKFDPMNMGPIPCPFCGKIGCDGYSCIETTAWKLSDSDPAANQAKIAAYDKMEDALTECILQLEYLNEKFPATGTSEATLTIARGARESARKARGE